MIGCAESGKEADWLFCPIAAEPAGKQANSNNYTDGSERTGSLYAHIFQQGIRPAKAFESTHTYIYINIYEPMIYYLGFIHSMYSNNIFIFTYLSFR